MKHVAVIYHFFPHYREAVLRELLASPHYDYLLVGDRNDPDGGIKAWDDIPSKHFLSAPIRKLGSRFYVQSGLIRLALRRDIDAIIFLGNPYFLSTWASALCARITGKKVFFWLHGWIQLESGPKGIIKDSFYRLSHGLLLYGHHAKSIGLKRGFPQDRLHVIYNSLDYERQKRIRASVIEIELAHLRRELFPNTTELPIVICTSRLTSVRRLDLLLEALKVLRDAGWPVNLLLVGDGPERTRLEATASKYQLSSHFYGSCYDESVLARLIMASNVTVAPGKVGLTAMHSLAYGVPVITHDDPEDQMPEWEAIQPGKNGDLFLRDDPIDLARAIRQWTSSTKVPQEVQFECYRMIDRFYNPQFQRLAIERALDGLPADDLFYSQGTAGQAGQRLDS